MLKRIKNTLLRLESMINYNQYMIGTLNQKIKEHTEGEYEKGTKELEYRIENPPLYQRGKFGKAIIMGVDLFLGNSPVMKQGYYYRITHPDGLISTVHENDMKK
jgi:hypothetical protein